MMVGAISQEGTDAGIQIQHRGKTDIDTGGKQLAGQQPAGLFHQSQGPAGIPRIEIAEAAAGGQAGKALVEALHPSSFVIHGDQQRGTAQFMNSGGERDQCLRVPVIARKQDDPAHQRVQQHLPLVRLQLDAAQVQHYRSQGHVCVTVASYELP